MRQIQGRRRRAYVAELRTKARTRAIQAALYNAAANDLEMQWRLSDAVDHGAVVMLHDLGFSLRDIARQMNTSHMRVWRLLKTCR